MTEIRPGVSGPDALQRRQWQNAQKFWLNIIERGTMGQFANSTAVSPEKTQDDIRLFLNLKKYRARAKCQSF